MPVIRRAHIRRTQALSIGVWLSIVVMLSGCVRTTSDAPITAPDAVDTASKIEAFCGKCHAHPDPKTFTWPTWEYGIRYMYRLFREHYPEDLNVIAQTDVESYYRANAAKELAWPQTYPPLPVGQKPQFNWKSVGNKYAPSIISHLGNLPDSSSQIIMSNAISGDVSLIDINAPLTTTRTIINTKHPSRTAVGDIDSDGHADYVVAELGTFTAKDTDLGQVRLKRRKNGRDTAETIFPARGRIADVKLADLDGNGRLDILIAEFGWHKTGGVHLLWNRGLTPDGDLKLSHQVLSTTPGAIGIASSDMNGDGRMDIVVNYAQHFERIDVLYQRSPGVFSPEIIFKAPTPLWGSLSIGVVDLDGDGRQDVLHVNGDALDSPKLANFQGIYWFRNTGDGRFTQTQLAQLPGAHAVTWGDYDGDGRLDVVGVANLPKKIKSTRSSKSKISSSRAHLDAAVFVKQSGSGRFTPYSLRQNDTCFSAAVTGDWDRDGDLDIALGAFGMGWTLLGHHDGIPDKPDTRLCSSGQVFLLENRGERSDSFQIQPVAIPRRDQIQQRRAALQTIVANDPKDARNRVNLGSILTQMGRAESAVKPLTEATSIDPRLPGAHLNLAIALERSKRLSEAKIAIQREIDIAPKSGDARNQHAIILFRQNKRNAAIQEIEKAIELNPRVIPYYENLGAFNAMSKRFGAARKAFERILELQPNHSGARQAIQRLDTLDSR